MFFLFFFTTHRSRFYVKVISGDCREVCIGFCDFRGERIWVNIGSLLYTSPDEMLHRLNTVVLFVLFIYMFFSSTV